MGGGAGSKRAGLDLRNTRRYQPPGPPPHAKPLDLRPGLKDLSPGLKDLSLGLKART